VLVAQISANDIGGDIGQQVGPFHVLYQQWALLSKEWHSLMHTKITELERITAALHWTIQHDKEDGSATYPASAVVQSRLRQLDCPCGAVCNSFRFQMNVASFVPLIARLAHLIAPQQPLTVVSPQEFFLLWRIGIRKSFLHNKVARLRLSRYPPPVTPLSHLYMMLPHKGDQIYVPLWELRHLLKRGGTRPDVQTNTLYSSLIFDETRLVPVNYQRHTAEEDHHSKVCCTARTLYDPGSEEERAQFLEANKERIAQDILYPSRIYRLFDMAPEQFRDVIDRHRRMLQQDCRHMFDFLSGLRDRFLATDCPEALRLLQYRGPKCQFCHYGNHL
jgi:hypothetical protein